MPSCEIIPEGISSEGVSAIHVDLFQERSQKRSVKFETKALCFSGNGRYLLHVTKAEHDGDAESQIEITVWDVQGPARSGPGNRIRLDKVVCTPTTLLYATTDGIRIAPAMNSLTALHLSVIRLALLPSHVKDTLLAMRPTRGSNQKWSSAKPSPSNLMVVPPKTFSIPLKTFSRP